jgi:hypothetical protein
VVSHNVIQDVTTELTTLPTLFRKLGDLTKRALRWSRYLTGVLAPHVHVVGTIDAHDKGTGFVVLYPAILVAIFPVETIEA